MSHADVFRDAGTPRRGPGFGLLGRELALGFAYWLAFMLVLEPGDISHALFSGGPIAWDQEALRLTGGALLGAVGTPPILALVRRFPIEGSARWRHAAFHLAGSLVVSATLIAASCVLAPWALASERRPLTQALPQQLEANLLLLCFSVSALVAIAHAVSRADRATRDSVVLALPLSAWPSHTPVRTRTGLLMVEVARIDWIETQGNYLALHVDGQAHLIRETSKRFELTLDPAHFTRIHRRTIVAVGRVREMTQLGSGDAVVRLDTGAELRVSRAYRERLRAQLL
jgi:hypothetical protein